MYAHGNLICLKDNLGIFIKKLLLIEIEDNLLIVILIYAGFINNAKKKSECVSLLKNKKMIRYRYRGC